MASTVWRGFLTFGLVSIPVRLYRAARAERISFRRVYRANAEPADDRADDAADPGEAEAPAAPPVASASKRGPQLVQKHVAPAAIEPQAAPTPEPVYERVQQAAVRRDTNDVIKAGSVAKGFEVEKGRYVVIDPEELKSIAPKTATEMEIAEFVRLADIDPVYFETSYYVVPEQAGQKAYALLFKALRDAGLVAIAQLAMHNREHVVVVRPGKVGLVAHTMFYQNEVRADEEYRADTATVTDREMKLAHQLIESLAGAFEPGKYHDAYREKLEAMIEQKRAGLPAAAEQRVAASTSVVDITAALERSLAALKKSPASETTAAPPARPGKSKRAGS